ncbi:MAG: hypothetical protein HY071_00605 [Chloroflexi bacterium]|nr:hypothetical protein [Chloroflexota bacterium]
MFGGGARADSPVIEALMDAIDATGAGDFSATGTGNGDVFVDISKTRASFFANNYVVVDARITYDLGLLLNPDCPPYLQILQSDAAKSTSGARVRRSAENRVSTQRVAIAQPQLRYYMLQIRRNSPGESTAGPCALIQSIPWTLKVRLFASAPASTGFGFTTMHLPDGGDGEPSIAVDRWNGDTVYVSAPVGGPAVAGGNPAGVDFWRSLDAGGNFTHSQPSFSLNAIGGFDSHLAVARNGDVWQADLGAAAIYVGVSHDKGATWTGTTPPGVDADREWLATYTSPGASAPSKVVVSYHDINVDNLPYECLILSNGVGQPVCNPMITDPTALANAFGNTFIGNQVFGSDGVVYAIVASPGAPTGGAPAATRNIYLAKSADAVIFTNKLIYSAPLGNDVAALFPVIAIDDAGNLYAVWSERVAPYGPSSVKLSTSTDHGNTWSAPRTVSTNTSSAVLPWAVAGASGKVDIVYAGSSNPSTNDPTADWYMYMASIRSATGAPVTTLGRISPQPIRYGSICLSGLGCTTGGDDGRILLDFTMVDRDSNGLAHVSYANSGPEGPTDDPRRTYTDYARQTSGGSLAH